MDECNREEGVRESGERGQREKRVRRGMVGGERERERRKRWW